MSSQKYQGTTINGTVDDLWLVSKTSLKPDLAEDTSTTGGARYPSLSLPTEHNTSFFKSKLSVKSDKGIRMEMPGRFVKA